MIAGNTCFHPHLASSTRHSTYHSYSIREQPENANSYSQSYVQSLNLSTETADFNVITISSSAQFVSSAGARRQYEGGIMPLVAAQSSPFNKQEMHRYVCNHKEGTRENGESNHILPECECIESKGTENRSPRNLDIKSIFVVD